MILVINSEQAGAPLHIYDRTWGTRIAGPFPTRNAAEKVLSMTNAAFGCEPAN